MTNLRYLINNSTNIDSNDSNDSNDEMDTFGLVLLQIIGILLIVLSLFLFKRSCENKGILNEYIRKEKQGAALFIGLIFFFLGIGAFGSSVSLYS